MIDNSKKAARVSAAEWDCSRIKEFGAAHTNWPDWYAAYMVAEQAGAELPT